MSKSRPNNHLKHIESFLTKEVPLISKNAKVGDLEDLLLSEIDDFKTINYAYILDEKAKLIGVVSIREIFRSDKNELVYNLSPKKIVVAHLHTPPERIAFLALKHRLKSIPILDKEKNFVGVIAHNEIIQILDSKSVENLLKFGGVMPIGKNDDIFKLSITKSLQHRLPWLIFGLFGGIVASGVVGNFEDVLSRNIVLASFIPLISYISDAIGTQMEAFIIRDLSFHENFNFFQYFIRQSIIVFAIGIILSIIFYLGSIVIYKDSSLSLAVSISLFIASLSSVFTGLAIPYIFERLNLDPANASGPVATIIQDIMSIFIYFSIASMII